MAVFTRIEGILAELLDELHKVPFDEGDLILQASLLSVFARTTDLEFIIVEANNSDICKTRDFTSGSTDAAADVQNSHTRTQTHLRCKVMLMTSERSRETLALVEAGEMERFCPTILIEFSCTVIVTCWVRKK